MQFTTSWVKIYDMIFFAHVVTIPSLTTSQLVESYKTSLPQWLTYNLETGVLTGVATPDYNSMIFSIDIQDSGQQII